MLVLFWSALVAKIGSSKEHSTVVVVTRDVIIFALSVVFSGKRLSFVLFLGGLIGILSKGTDGAHLE